MTKEGPEHAEIGVARHHCAWVLHTQIPLTGPWSRLRPRQADYNWIGCRSPKLIRVDAAKGDSGACMRKEGPDWL